MESFPGAGRRSFVCVRIIAPNCWRPGRFTGRRTSSIRTWNNVKALASLIDDPATADPACAKVVGYGPEWCVAEGLKQNVTSSIRHALVGRGYNVQLYGKIDTGGGVCRHGIDICDGTGYHDSGNWSVAVHPLLLTPLAVTARISAQIYPIF